MTTNPSDAWSPQEGTTTFTETFSHSRYSYTSHSDTQRVSSDGEDSAQHMRRLAVSPSPSQEDDSDDAYSDDNSIDEVDATLNNLDDELDNTEQAVSEWSHGSYSSGGPTFSSATGTFTYSGTYTGSPSFVSLPTFSPRSPPQQPLDPRARLSRITERTEESRPSSTAFSISNVSRPANPTPENLRRSALLGGGTPSHSRSSTDPSSDRTLPPPGRLGELLAVFESQSPSTGHSRAASTPGYRATSPMFGTAQSATTGYGYGSTSYAYGSRPSSPAKSGSGSSGSYIGSDTRSSLLSPPQRPTTATGFRSSTTGIGAAGTYSNTATPSTFSNTNTWTNANTTTQTGSYTTPNTESKSYSGTEETFTRTSVTPSSGLRRPQTSPRSPLASVRNIVALWKERTPASGRTGEKSGPGSASSVSPPPPPQHENDGLYGIRRRVEGARARLRESRGVSNPVVTPTRPISEDIPDDASIRSGRSGVFPPGFDLNEFSNYSQSKEPPIHIGLLWYLNVHASPPYRWQRCQALLYPHMLLLSWLAPGGGRGIVALDLLNCTSVQSAPSPTHPSAREDVGTLAARQQSAEQDAQPLMDMLVPFHMMYADGVERLAAESLLERQKWVNRLWEAVNRPIAVPDSISVTRSPTGSIRTILSINSSSSSSSNGSRSTVFVPPLSSLPEISDFHSTTSGLSRQSSIISSHHTRTVDDTVIQNQEYVYPGDPRVITPNHGSSLRRSGSMTDLDDEFKLAVNRARGGGGLFGGSPVTISSGSSLGKNIFVTPPPSVGRGGSDLARSDVSDEHFFSAGSSDGARSNVSSTYFSQASLTSTGGLRTMTGLTTATSETQVPTPTYTSTYRTSESGSYRHGDSDVSFANSPSTLSRAREIRRRVAGTARSYSSGYQTEASESQSESDKENDENASGSRTPTGSYTPGSGSASLSGSYNGSYLDSRSRTPTGSYSGSERPRSGSYIGSGSHTGSDSYTPSGSYTPGSGSHTLQDEANGIDSTSSSGIGGHTPISSSETGYDVCSSSDLTDLTPLMTSTQSETATPLSAGSVTLSDAASEKFITASQASTEYATAVVQSSRASITSFESFPTIPGSEYLTAESVSTEYHTVSELGMETEFVTASEPSPETEYVSYESELEEIPSESQLNTPVLSSLKLGSEPDEERSIVYVPSVIPTIRSPSLFSELLPEEIPLPPSAPSSVPQPPPQPLPLPVPSPSPSLSPSLSPSPSPLGSSTEERDVITPTSFQMPPTTESLELEDHIDEETVSLSLLSSLPPSTLGSTSVLTPTSLVISSASTASTLPPSTPVIPPTTMPSSSVTQSSISTSGDMSFFTQTSSSLLPPSPQPWASATDISYESSILQPSPSVLSIALHEGVETSFETSFLRPSGSPSSLGRMSTIPPSPSLLSSAPPQSPLQPLTPVPALPPSISSPTDVATPTSLMFSSESSSSLGRTLSTYSTLSYISQSSLSSSIFESGSEIIELEPEQEPESVSIPSPSTEPSLLSTPRPSSHRSPTPSPSPIPSLITPEASLVVSITTPQGSGATEQSSLRTIPSVSTVTERDLGHDMDNLVDELRTYDHARGLENQEIADNVRALRDELRALADFLHRTPSPPSIGLVPGEPPREPPHTGIHLVDRSVGGSSIVSLLHPGGPRVMEVTLPAHAASSLSRSTSNASSAASYLSSHHSDDYLLEEELETPMVSPAVWGPEDITADLLSSPEESSSSSVSSSPLSRSSDLSSGGSTVRQQAPDVLEQALRGIQDQLRALEDGQATARNLLDALQERPEDHTAELADRLHRIEELIQNLVDQGHPRGPEIVFPQPPISRTESISESSDSLRRLRSILRDLAAPQDAEGPHMPLPVTATSGTSVAQQLDDILSSAHNLPPTGARPDLPRVVPFIYQPSERGARARSASPVSMETLPRRPPTVPIYAPRLQRPRDRRTRERRTEPSEPESTAQPTAIPPRPVPEDAEEVLNDMRRTRDAAQQQRQQQPTFRVGPGPTPRPVVPDLYGSRRAETAPPDLGEDEARPGPQSWYRPPQQTRTQAHRPPPMPTTAGPSVPLVQPQPAGTQYMPMPAGPTIVQLPPLFDSLMEILRENRLAQLATVDQQRELMRYMRGLNEWLERDVHDRQSEIRGVVARVEQLSHDIRGMQVRGRRPSSESSGSSDGSETAIYQYPTAPQGPPMPQPFGGLPTGFQPYPDRPVIPGVVPDHGTPRPTFPPVIPQMHPQPTIIVNPPGVIPGGIGAPGVPTDGYHAGGPGPQPVLHAHTDQPTVPFIPPDLSSRSTGSPRPPIPIPMPQTYGSGMGPNIIHVAPSPSSSISSSTRRSRSPSRRSRRPISRSPSRRSRRRSSRSPSRRAHGYSPSPSRSHRGRSRSPVPLIVTNPSAGMLPAGIQPSMYQQPPTVHIVPPSAGTSAPGSPRMYEGQPQPQQPTIIVQQPPQQQLQPIIQQPPPSPYMQPMSAAGIPMSTGPGMVPMTAAPIPVMTPAPGSYYPPPMTGAPMIIQQGSPRSSRSRSSRRRRRTPPAAAPAAPAAPVIITETRRSRSRSPRGRTPPPQMPPGVTLLPSQPFGAAPPGVMMMPTRSPSSRSRRSRRSRSRERAPIIVQQPGQAAPTIYPQPMTQAPAPQPQVVVPSAMGMGIPPPVLIPRSYSRSRSHSPRRDVPIVIPPAVQQPSYRRSRSRSPHYRQRSRSPRSRTRSPTPRRRSRSPSPRRRRSRTPSPRRRRRSRSRTPPPSHYPPTVPMTTTVLPQQPIGMIPSRYPTYRSRGSRSPSRSPPRVEVVGEPRARRRSRSPGRYYSPPRHRYPSLSPRRRERPYSPSYADRAGRRRYSPPRPRCISRSPSYDSRDSYRSRPRYRPTRGRRRSYSPLPRDRSRRSPPRSRTLSPLSTRTYSPTPISRIQRQGSPSRGERAPTYRPGESPAPHRILATPARQPSGYAAAEEVEEAEGPLRVTVPPARRAEPRRPPTVMTIESEERPPHVPGVSRTGTPRRPSGHYAHSAYGEPRSPPPEVHVITVPPSERGEHGIPSYHAPSQPAPVEQLGLPTSRRPSQREAPPRPPLAEAVEEAARPLPSRPHIETVSGERPVSAQPPRPATVTPFDFRVADENRQQLEELNQAANRLYAVAAEAEEAEDRRELEFRHHEDHREEVFLENEERRTQESRDRAAGIWNELESRLSGLPPPPARPAEQPVAEELAEQKRSDRESIASIRTLATQAATQHAAAVMETIQLERDEAARDREAGAEERAQLLAELRMEKDRVIQEKDNRIKALEDELAQLRGEFETEKQQRATEESELRERERQELVERDEFVRAQLGDITNLVQDQRDMCETKKVLMDARWEEKQARRQDKEAQMIELRDMVQKIHEDMEADRNRCEEERRQSREALEKIVDDLQRQNAEQRELLTSLSESWRADCEKHHEETLNAVRSTANEQVPFNVQGYLDEFSRALATEVRMLLGEVGRIREERRALQHEIGDLLCMKAKYGPGGEYEPDWKPSGPSGPPPPPEGMPPQMPEPPEVPPPVKPAWRTIHPRPKKKKKGETQPAASTSAPPPASMRMSPHAGYSDLRHQLTHSSWATWQPDRSQVTPPSVEPTLMVPGRESPGLFGPRSPTASMYEPRR